MGKDKKIAFGDNFIRFSVVRKVLYTFLYHKRHISNAEDLILICCRSNRDEGLKDKAKKIAAEGIDWESFRENALQSGRYLSIYNLLKSISSDAVIPSSILEPLKTGYLQAVSSATGQYNELKKVLKLFYDKGIPVIPLKGSMLAKRLYGDIAARGVSIDIDLLVEEENRDKAREALEASGYTSGPPGIRDHFGQRTFGKKDHSVIDLHWRINPVVDNSERVKGFWKGARLRNEDGVFYYELKEEELILQLSAHFVDSSHLIQLKHICDIHELLEKYGAAMDWESVADKAFEWRLSGSLYTTLLFSEKLFGPSVPNKVMEKIKPGPAKRILINILAERGVILNKNSKRRRFIKFFMKYILLQFLEAKSLRDYFVIFFPLKEKMGNRTYADRIAGGVSKLKLAMGFKRA